MTSMVIVVGRLGLNMERPTAGGEVDDREIVTGFSSFLILG